MKHSEQNLIRKKSGLYEWLVELTQAFIAVQYWRLRLCQQQYLKVSESLLEHTLRMSGWPPKMSAPTTLPKLLELYKSTRQYAKSCQNDHISLRESYLAGLVDAIVSKRYPHLDHQENLHLKLEKITHETPELYERECRWRMYKKIGHTLQSDSDNTNGLYKIDTPAGHQDPFPQGPDPKTLAGAWASITNPEEIVRHICAANLHQYNQANNTPFATEPLKS